MVPQFWQTPSWMSGAVHCLLGHARFARGAVMVLRSAVGALISRRSRRRGFMERGGGMVKIYDLYPTSPRDLCLLVVTESSSEYVLFNVVLLVNILHVIVYCCKFRSELDTQWFCMAGVVEKVVFEVGWKFVGIFRSRVTGAWQVRLACLVSRRISVLQGLFLGGGFF